MTELERIALRLLIDATKREQLRQLALGDCAGCGCEYDTRTPGCSACGKRHYLRRRWRRDPAYRERKKIEHRSKRARQRDRDWHRRHDHELQRVLDEERAKRKRAA